MSMLDDTPPLIRPIVIGRLNRIGFWTLYWREVMRFVKIIGQTIAAPVVTTWLFLTVFSLALQSQTGARVGVQTGLDLVGFLAPGLVMMGVLQNAFANSSTSLVVSKVQGNIVDLLMPPLGSYEVFFAVVAAAMTRGILVAMVASLTLVFFDVRLIPLSPLLAVMFLLLSTAIMGVLGLIAGIWAEKFDSLATISNFVIMPLVFLSGTFYTIDRLPESFRLLAWVNPVFYMIDGFRYAMMGLASASVLVGAGVLVLTLLVLSAVAIAMLRTGYRLKA